MTADIGAPGQEDFYPRSPGGERRARKLASIVFLLISIHAPREGSGSSADSGGSAIDIFLSTLPGRGAAIRKEESHANHNISIHAPREGSGDIQAAIQRIVCDFYPRSPGGERLL